ncbi:hypothetical protein MY11210_008376 [Beauveria gryllotalpidicola]
MGSEPAHYAVPEAYTQPFERQLAENSMEYMIFILDDKLEGIKYLNRLESISKEAYCLMRSVDKNYIWQRDEFNLSVVNEQGLIYLHGITDYGDAVEDEWLIVYVLRELSKAHPELFIRVADEDGEFLLVEAANALPNWLNPENDHCRVWIHSGKLVVIPLLSDKTKLSTAKSLTLADAVKCLRNETDTLIHSPSIEDEAFYRLEKYPKHVDASIHYSTLTIPRKLAYIVHELPKTVSAAVEAFYLRDHTGMKKITSDMEELHLPPTDLVTVSVKFSRVLFAQLRSQRFEAPQRWHNSIQSYAEAEERKDGPGKNVLGLEDGMKLTCGYEMLAMTAEKNKNRTIRELAIMLQDLKEDGDEELPTNQDMEMWLDFKRNDDESWLDINYEDFERELEGKRTRPKSKNGHPSGFGDSRTQEDLKKIVSRFEAFLNNDTAGLDGAEINEMDMDNDEDDNTDEFDDESGEHSDMEDKGVSFDEETFSRMMKEMMGLPVDNPTMASTGQYRGQKTPQSTTAQDAPAEDEDIRDLSMQMEAELKGHGALWLDRLKSQQSKLAKEGESRDKAEGEEKPKAAEADRAGTDEDSDGQVDINYNLAKNLLESFKSQGGMSGPTGNLLGLMGFQLPRDEDDGEKHQ